MSLIRLTACLACAATLTACLPAPPPEPEPPEPVALGPAPKKFTTEKPYFNTSATPVAVRSGPDAGAPAVASLAQGESGMVKTCEPTEIRCQIAFGEFGATGWIDMASMATK